MPILSFTFIAKSTCFIVSMCKVNLSKSKCFSFVEDTYIRISQNLAIFLKEIREPLSHCTSQSEKSLTCVTGGGDKTMYIPYGKVSEVTLLHLKMERMHSLSVRCQEIYNIDGTLR